MSSEASISTLGDDTTAVVNTTESTPAKATASAKAPTKGETKAVDKSAKDTKSDVAGGDEAAVVVDGLGFSGKKVHISIPPTKEDGHTAVFVSVNNRPYHIPRGKKVEVPVEILEALNCAVERTYDPTTGEGRDTPRHNVQVLVA